MAQVNAYNGVNAASGSGYQQRPAGKTELGMQDFLNLMSKQLANQDVMNPQSETDFIAQMAQFTSLQAMQTLTELTYAQYGASMTGKYVTVASYDASGKYQETKGIVESVQFADGDCKIKVNGEVYSMSSIMEVLSKIPEEGEGDKGEGDKDEDTGTDTGESKGV